MSLYRPGQEAGERTPYYKASTPSVPNSCGSGRLGTFSNRNSTLSGRFLLAKYFLAQNTDETTQGRALSLSRPFHCTSSRPATETCLFLLRPGFSRFVNVFIINPTGLAQNKRASLALAALKPGARFSSLLISFVVFLSRMVSSTLKSCSGRYPFSSISFLWVAENSLAATSLADADSLQLLVFLRLNLCLKFLNQHLLAVKSGALPVPSTPSLALRALYKSLAFFHDCIQIYSLFVAIRTHKKVALST